jgi:hypothetical protein
MKTYLELLVENSLDAPQIVCLVEAVVVTDYALQVCILLDILLGPAPVDPPHHQAGLLHFGQCPLLLE